MGFRNVHHPFLTMYSNKTKFVSHEPRDGGRLNFSRCRRLSRVSLVPKMVRAEMHNEQRRTFKENKTKSNIRRRGPARSSCSQANTARAKRIPTSCRAVFRALDLLNPPRDAHHSVWKSGSLFVQISLMRYRPGLVKSSILMSR